jgi:hypothetical protein
MYNKFIFTHHGTGEKYSGKHCISIPKPHSKFFYIQRRGDSIDMQIQCSSVNYLLLKIYNTRQTQTKF